VNFYFIISPKIKVKYGIDSDFSIFLKVVKKSHSNCVFSLFSIFGYVKLRIRKI
jgi:hypothetical protein